MCRLIYAFVVRTWHKQVFSWCGSYYRTIRCYCVTFFSEDQGKFHHCPQFCKHVHTVYGTRQQNGVLTWYMTRWFPSELILVPLYICPISTRSHCSLSQWCTHLEPAQQWHTWKRHVKCRLHYMSTVFIIGATAQQNQHNDLCTRQILRSVQSDQSSLCTKWVAQHPSFFYVDSDGW